MIFYNKYTGHIEQNIRISPKSCEKMVNTYEYLECMEGTLDDVNKYRVNVSVTPHTIEIKPAPTINIPEYCRQWRKPHLKFTDWTQMPDSPLSDAQKTQWATYRQALRDMPSTNADCDCVEDIIYPTKPS